MARTYHAEGRQLAKLLKAILIAVGLLIYMNIPGLHWGFFIAYVIISIVLSEIAGTKWTQKRRLQKKGSKQSANKSKEVQTKQANTKRVKSKQSEEQSKRSSTTNRSDDIILSSQLANLSGSEFERLLALYFRDQGYTVKEVGVGGNDGGVDLVIIDHRGEKTAVQAKRYAENNKVNVQTVRELVAAKRNHDCILTLLVTTSDLTAPAKKEAEQFKVDYWHGAIVEQKLKAWKKWQPNMKLARSK